MTPTPDIAIRDPFGRFAVVSNWVGLVVLISIFIGGCWIAFFSSQSQNTQGSVANSTERKPLDGQQIGVIVIPLSADEIGRLKLGNTQGVIVAEISPNTAGAEAGLRTGDVILVLGNCPIRSVGDWERAVRTMAKGTRKPVEVVREGYRLTLNVSID